MLRNPNMEPSKNFVTGPPSKLATPVNIRHINRCRGSLEVKVMDSWPVCHDFEPSTTEDSSYVIQDVYYTGVSCGVEKRRVTEDYDLPSAMEFLKNRKDFFKDLRLDTALNEMLCDARAFADEIYIPANFELTQPRHRIRRRNVNFDYEA
ncbi:uncharacterized protein TNCV_1522221 [Trichonephila clavipes]|nr:uncharacterized protein TNCV_1522221 [Trichonephila clavipes]